MSVRVCAVALSLVIATPPMTHSQSVDSDLATGIRQAQEGDFEAAVLTLDTVANRLRTQPARSRDLARAYLYLSVAHLGLSQESQAKTAFHNALAADKDLQVSPKEFPPRVYRFFEDARRSMGVGQTRKSGDTQGSTPAPPETRPPGASTTPSAGPAAAPPPTAAPPSAKKGGGSKVALVVLGVAGAAGAAVALAGGGSGSGSGDSQPRCSDQSGTLVLSGARFETPFFECPEGGAAYTVPLTIVVDTRNSRCAPVQISSGEGTLTVVQEYNTTLNTGETYSYSVGSLNPSSIPGSSTPATVRIDRATAFTCRNLPGPSYGAFWEFRGAITLVTTAGNFTVQTSNTHRTNFQ